jgi:FtsZ-interacting cell division protein ZipA
LNCKKTKRVGEELIVIGITILLCTLFFVFFGTRLLIDTAYLEDTPQNDTTSVSDYANTDNIEEETTTMSSITNDNASKSVSVSIEDESTTKKMQEAQTKSTTTIQQASISIPGVKSMKISKDSKTASVDLYNPSKNNCYFEISIILKDSNKQIYKSNLVRPGQHIYQIDLSQTLPKGEYTAILHYDTYAMDDNYTELNGANIEFTLIVE